MQVDFKTVKVKPLRQDSKHVEKRVGEGKQSSRLACQIKLENTDEHFDCCCNESLLKGMERLGRKGIPVGCRNGGCGICKVQIVGGEYQLGKMSRAHISEVEEQDGIVLACRCNPLTDLQLKALDKFSRLINKSRKN